MNRKVKSFKQTVFLLEQCVIPKVPTSVRSAIFWRWQPTIILPLIYWFVDKMLFEVSAEICCSGVSSRYCCCGNQQGRTCWGYVEKTWYRSVTRLMASDSTMHSKQSMTFFTNCFWQTQTTWETDECCYVAYVRRNDLQITNFQPNQIAGKSLRAGCTNVT